MKSPRICRQTCDDKDAAIGKLSRQLKDEFEDGMPEVQGMWSDLLSAALSEVDWYEIAEAMLEEVEFEQDEEVTDSPS